MKLKKKFIASLLAGALCAAFLPQQPAEAAIKQIGFGNISMPANISNDEFVIKALYFAVKSEAQKKLKKYKVDYDGTNAAANDAVVMGIVESYELKQRWRDPSISTHSDIAWTKTRKWYDSKNKEHTETITRYEEKPSGSPGGYYFRAYCRATLNLVDAKSGAILVQYRAEGNDDKEIDIFYSIVRSFYKKVNKELKQQEE